MQYAAGCRITVHVWILNFFSFFLQFFPSFCKNIWSAIFFQNYASGSVGDGGRDLPPCPTAVGARDTAAPATAVGRGGRGPVCFQNFVIFLFEPGWR
jgi:hypothetical protein